MEQVHGSTKWSAVDIGKRVGVDAHGGVHHSVAPEWAVHGELIGVEHRLDYDDETVSTTITIRAGEHDLTFEVARTELSDN